MAAQDVVRWRVWYVGGEVREGKTFTDWQTLPDDGVLIVMLYHEDGTRRIEQGNDSYWATPEGAYAHSNDPAEEIKRRYVGASVKRGKWTTDAEMQRVEAEAMGAE